MRYVFLALVVILMQLFSLGLAHGVHWLLRPWWQPKFITVAALCLIVGNAMLAGFFVGMFRLPMGYLALLWLVLLSALLTMAAVWLLSRMGIALPMVNRALALISFIGLMGWALHQAYVPTVRYLELAIDKPMGAPVTLAVASDLHLGALYGNRGLMALSKIVARENVDVLLMAGDIMDDDTRYYVRNQMAPNFKAAVAQAKVAAVATLGNHDLYRSHEYENIQQAIRDTGAILLMDDVTTVSVEKDGKRTKLQIIGRFDDHHTTRLPTEELLARVDGTQPVIVIDHRPSDIDKHSTLNIDLQVSGHTHNGQLFPANFIVKAINRLGYGYEKINGKHFLVSSGLGFWGVPLRLGSRSEVWIVRLTGQSVP